MLNVGTYSTLPVIERVPTGLYLGNKDNRVFLPARLAPEDISLGEKMRVFVYLDGQQRLTATTIQPTADVGEFAYLQCVNRTSEGAFLDWGMPKDLYVPRDEQTMPMHIGKSYVVGVRTNTDAKRVFGSARIKNYLDPEIDGIRHNDQVRLLVFGKDDHGVQVIVDNRYRGLVHFSDLHQELNYGQSIKGYVRQVREDGRLDIVLTSGGRRGITDAGTTILRKLEKQGGKLALHDKSSPEEILAVLGLTKKAFKRGLGSLYKSKKVQLTADGVVLCEDTTSTAPATEND